MSLKVLIRRINLLCFIDELFWWQKKDKLVDVDHYFFPFYGAYVNNEFQVCLRSGDFLNASKPKILKSKNLCDDSLNVLAENYYFEILVLKYLKFPGTQTPLGIHLEIDRRQNLSKQKTDDQSLITAWTN